MRKTFLQYAGLAFVVAMVMSMQFGPADAGPDASTHLAERSAPASRGEADPAPPDANTPDRSTRSRSEDREASMERPGSLRIRVAKGVVQA